VVKSPVTGELLRQPIVPAIAPYPVGVNDEILRNALQLRTPNDFFGSIAEVD